MIAIKTQINGHDASLAELGSVVEQTIYLDIAEAIQERLKSFKCSEHERPLEAIILKKTTGRPVLVHLVGCCCPFVARCEQALD
jgi:hypothetical protein